MSVLWIYFFKKFIILFQTVVSTTGFLSVVLGRVGCMHNATFVPCVKVAGLDALAN